MKKNSLVKLLPIVLFSSLFSILTVYIFRSLVWHPLYQNISQLIPPFFPPFIGAILLIVLYYIFTKHLKSGLAHVVLEFHIGTGKLPFLNFIFQFLAASVALLSGFAVGAIGPAIHIGAASSNLVGQYCRLDSQILRVLTACGSAIAITIMLNTPLMAILFTYETIIRQFRWRVLILVCMVTCFAQWLSHYLNISPMIIEVTPFSVSFLLLIKMLLLGGVCGLVSSVFLNSIDLLTRKVKVRYWKKILIAALVTSLFTWAYPITKGLGSELLVNLLYDTPSASLLAVFLAARLLMSAGAIALAIPGGALGPSLILGALTGALFSQLFNLADNQIIVLVGMGAVLGAVLHVPLAGILFVLESTYDINLLLPCALAAYSAYYIHKRFSWHNNIVELLLARQNVVLRHSPSLKKKHLTSPL